MGIVKKITCLVLVVMMLLSSFITPITILAEEIEKSVNESEKEIVEISNEKELAENYDETAGLENGSSEEEKNEEPQSKEENQSSKENIAESNENREEVPNKPKMLKAPLGAAPTGGNELKDRVKPTTKENLTVKMKNDEYEINQFKTQFVSGAKLDVNGNLVWTPENSAEGHDFTFRVNYAISGLKELPAESIQITIPKSILRNRSGNFADKYEMSLPSSDQYEGDSELIYTEMDNYIVVYNPEEVKAGINGYFEIAYSTNSETFEYKDYDATNAQLITEGGTASDPFYATINVNTGDDNLKGLTDDINLYIDTVAKIESTQKRYPTIYRSWNPSWMSTIPEDKDEYYYLVWEIRTSINRNLTQRYNFSLQDSITDLTPNTEWGDYQIVGYKLAGQQYYTDKNTQQNQKLDGYRYDYVLTRHKISTYSDREYTLKNTVTAVIDPIDQVDNDTKATSSNTFFWDPSFQPPTGHFYLYKHGNNDWNKEFGYYWDYANYDLDKMQNGEIDKLEGFKYSTETVGYAYPWTLREGGSLNEPEDYGYNKVTYDTWDDTLYLEDDENPMSYQDYYIDKLEIKISNSDARYDDFFNKFGTKAVKYGNDETIVFYGKFRDSDEWVEIGTYNLGTKEIIPNSTYVSEMTGSLIKFNEGVNCVGWRAITSNKHYYTSIIVNPYITITNSEYVNNKIANKDSIKVQNNVSTNIFDYKGNIIFENDASAIDYARVTYYDSRINKSVSSVSNDIVNKQYNIRWTVDAWERATTGSGESEYVRQSTGKFYDLIPLGGEINIDTIQIKTENGYLPENEYSYEVIPNYNGSGRSMLIIDIKEQAQYYKVYYTTVHSWEGMKDFGKDVLNPVAYETGNEEIYNGYPDDGGNLGEKNKSLYVDLDKQTDANKFIYTESKYNINAITAAIAGLNKKVKNSDEASYSYYTEVEPDGKYAYQLRYENNLINKAKDLIFFDSLENFEIVNSKEETTKTSGWRGTLKSIDLSQLKSKGIDPVVYVSTIDNLDLEENNDVTDETVWTKLSMFEDYSDVKAIAIDMTKDIFGNEYVLSAGDSISAIVHMEAPENITDEIEENPYTYNNIYIKDTLIDDLGGSEEYFIHQDYTTVKYHVVANVPITKVNANDENEPIKGITFRLYGTSDYDKKVDEYVTSDKDGQVIFKKIEAGEYTLQEYEATPDWLEDHTEHKVEITNQGIVHIDGQLISDISTKKITNMPRIHADVAFSKMDLVNNKLVSGSKFKLSGTSNYGNEILMFSTSDEHGEVKFENLEYGTYDLIETEAPEGYIINREKFRVIVDENGNYDIQRIEKSDIVKYAHSINIDDTGNVNLSSSLTPDYDFVFYDTQIVTIEGAKKLHVDIKYGFCYGYVAVYDGTVEPTSDNYEESVSGMLNEYSSSMRDYHEKEFDIDGDTVGFFYRTWDYEAYLPYGYYAKITVPEEAKSIYNKGNYIIYNEPLHNFRVVKKDSYSDKIIEGAKFKLYGISDYGNAYNEEIESNSIGFADFGNLEAGSYVLQETYVPSVPTEDGDEITYVLDDNKYPVRIEKDGTVTIDGIKKNENGNFVFYNKRNKKTITITKKWEDNSNNDERQEPIVHLSTQKPDESNCAYLRENCEIERNVSRFVRDITSTEEEVKSKDEVYRMDNKYYDPNAEYKIYFWYDTDTCHWWSNAEVIKMTDKSARLFYPSMYAIASNNVQYIDMKDIDTSEVTDMSYMFSNCQELVEIDNMANMNTSNVTNMSNMFSGSNKLEEFDISHFDTSKVTDMSYMFGGRIYGNMTNLEQGVSLEDINLKGLDTKNVTNMKGMFYGCKGTFTSDLMDLNTSNVTDMSYMFYKCDELEELDLSKFDTRKVTDMSYMFYKCQKLQNLDITNLDTGNVTNMCHMFDDCEKLQELDVSNWDTSKVTDMSFMFEFCYNLQELDVSNWNTKNVTNMKWLFRSCSSLQELDVSNWDTSNVTDMSSMFDYCSSLNTIYASNKFVTSQELSMFYNCNALVGGNGTKYSDAKVNDMTYARIDKQNQPGYFTYKEPTVTKLSNASIDNDIDKTYLKEALILLAQNEENSTSEVLSYSTADTNYDDEGNEVHWVKDGDTWTYTFYVDDPNATWYVWEDKMDGYQTSCSIYTPVKVENKKATIYNYLKEKEDFIERELIKGFNGLEITKEVYRRDSEGDYVLNPEDNTEFTVKIQLMAGEGVDYDLSGIKVFGNNVFYNGIGRIKIKSGETVNLEGIPYGLKYRMSEENLTDRYVPESEMISGEILKGEISQITLKNYKQEEPEEETTSFTVSKEVTGNYEIEDEYTIEIALDGLKPNITYNLSDGTTYQSDSTGSANITVKLSNGESITVQDIPVGARYKVYEHEGKYVSSYVIKDANNLGLINNSAAKNTNENVAISTMTEIADEGEAVTITFTNEKQVTQDLKIKKAVTDEEDTDSYIFNIELTGMKSGYAFNSTVGKIIADENGKAELTIYLAGGEEAELYGIPVGTKYRITELASNSIASYMITDENGVDNIVKAENANSVNRTSLSTEEETVNEGEEVIITFINDTVDQEPDKVTTSVGVKKSVLGINGEQLEDCEDVFTFEIKAEDENNPMPENKTVTIEGNGEASFGELTFEKTGTYTYTIVEKVGDLEEYEYDDTVYTIVYEVTNTEGLLEITKTVKKDGFQGEAIEFINKMHKVDVKILKVDEDEDPLEGVVMQIVDEDGNVVKEWTTGDENSEGAAIDLRLETGTYILREKEGPEGYELSKDIEFVVNEDGTVTVAGEEVDLIINKGKRPETKEEPEQESENTKEEKSVINVKTGDNIVIYEYILVISIIAIAIVIKKK